MTDVNTGIIKTAASFHYKMGLLFLMYIVQKIFLCFSWTLIPIILRSHGASLGSIGFTALVYSPWALKFLYAFAVDRFYNLGLGRRKSWIVPLLIISEIILLFLAVLPPEENLKLFMICVFVLNLIFATTDVAVDGYATDMLEPHERPWGNTVQMTAYVIAYMLGAGVFLIVYENQGWLTTLLMIAALQLILMIPVLFHDEISLRFLPGSSGIMDRLTLNLPRFLRQPNILIFLIFSALLTISCQGGSQLRLPLLIDLGFDRIDLGKLNIWVGAPMTILGSIFGGFFLKSLGLGKVFAMCCTGIAGLNFFSAFISHNLSPVIWQIMVMTGWDKLMTGIVMVLIYNTIMTLSSGHNSATRYAILCSITHLAGLGIMPITGNLCDITGYFKLYTGLGTCALMTLFMGICLLRYPLNFFYQSNQTKEQHP
ncbi:MFS transporter [Desulfobacula phenolica]|uniref:Major Facilitator Superfamily protein n=1 Tax=Desulfobacula phenolica TaxID=90732 RepID=A0A1H2GMT5_9BACT|nr:MFS transporter [Desulfobacula phenolica]SDU20940.1 Major Facilitator Superfamily protein [Desulfobacula phenolica]